MSGAKVKVVLAACLMVVLAFGYYAVGSGILAGYAAGVLPDQGEHHRLVVPAGPFKAQLGSDPGERPGTRVVPGR